MSEQQAQGADAAIDLNNELKTRREKLAALREQGVAFPNDFRRDHTSDQLHAEFDGKENEELEALNIEVAVAGRMMTRRIMGKASFVTLQDVGGRIQLYVARDDLPEGVYNEQFKKWDLGDILGAKGKLFKTKTGELSIHCTELRLLTKALRPLPDKFHGLQDQEARYRQRYLDLISNDEARNTFKVRSQILSGIRQFMVNRGFMEVETPMMQVIPGGAAARPFITHHNALDLDMYLRIAPELYLKRLVVGGFERVFEINRNFRNEGISVRHNPEFTMMELYMAYADYKDLIELTESLFRTLAQDILGNTEVPYGDQVFDFGKPFEKLTMREAIKKYRPETEMADLDNFDSAKAIAESIGIKVEKSWGLGRIVTEIFEEVAEAHLIQPTFITEYPAEVSPLARRNDVNPEITDRFEFFIGGREIGNGFSELNDAEDQAQRFQDQVDAKAAGDDEAMFYDEDYVTALEHGLPPTAGLGIGIDRMVMLFTNSHTIRDVILFPTMKPLDMPKKSEKAEEKSAESAPAAAPCSAGIVKPKGAHAADEVDKVESEPIFEEQVEFDTFAKSDYRAVKIKECTAVPKSKKLLKFVLDDGSGTDRVILSGIHDYYEPEDLVGKTAIAIVNLPPRKMMGHESCGMLLSAVHTEKGEERLNLIMVDDKIPAGAKLC